MKYLDNFGFTTLAHGTEADKDANGNVWSDANLATALGGITRGVTNVELCASYAAIANNGNYIKPIYYTKILDHNGNVLIENTAAERSVIKESTAFLLTEKQVQPKPITTCGLWVIHHIIHAQYGPVMTTMRNYLIMRVTSTKLYGKRL